MLERSSRSSVEYASSDRFSPSTSTATRARSWPSTGTRTEAWLCSSQAISAGGRRRAGDRGSSRKISSGSSDQRSIVTTPPSSGSGSTAPFRVVTGTRQPSSIPVASIAVISGCSAWSICSTTRPERSAGSVSNRTRPASETRILRASYTFRRSRGIIEMSSSSRRFGSSVASARGGVSHTLDGMYAVVTMR